MKQDSSGKEQEQAEEQGLIRETSSQELDESVSGPKLSPTGKEMWVGKTHKEGE